MYFCYDDDIWPYVLRWCCTFWCLNKLYLLEKHLPHDGCWHWFGLICECNFRCSNKLYFLTNDLVQFGQSHENRLPVWMFLWASKCGFCLNLLLQFGHSHVNGLSWWQQQRHPDDCICTSCLLTFLLFLLSWMIPERQN